MADLSDIQAAQTVKIVGSDSAGFEQTPVQSTTGGAIHTNLRTGAGQEISSTSNGIATGLQVAPFDGFNLDATGRQRFSEPNLLANFCFYQGLQNLNFNQALTGSATIAFNANLSAAVLSTTTSASDSVIYQSKEYFAYSPGIGYTVNVAADVGAAKTNVTKRWGMYDSRDGLGFSQTISGMSIFYRTSSSGSPVDTSVAQASWNLDPMDGTGVSGATLNPAFHNQYIISYVWHGAGRVRWGIFLNGKPYYFHHIDFANSQATPYTRTPKLPIRTELVNTGTVASSTSFSLTCASLLQESSSKQIQKYNFSRSSVRAGKTSSPTGVVLISLQPLANFNGIVNRVSIVPVTAQIFANNQNVLVQVILNTTLTGASFTSVDTNSASAVDTSATNFSGGTVIAEFYTESGTVQGFDLSAFATSTVLSNTIAGAAGDILTLVAYSVTANTTTFAALRWEEY